MPKTIQIRVQSVHTTYFETDQRAGRTLGDQIEALIRDFKNDGHHPNKIVIDLNPKEEPQPNDIEA